jgi:D-erythronate 2-dehydrogenase
MTIIVTGAAGFVGRALVAELLASGHNIVAIDREVEALGAHPLLHEMAGDIADTAFCQAAFRFGCHALVHLATVPGGTAEADPHASRRINIDAMYNLLELAKNTGTRPRVVYASSIAVFGDPLPPHGVDDTTPLAPKMVYGGHKAMMELAVNMLHQRGEIDGVTVRLPGILARPKAASGMKSAFMSDIFHALRAGESYACPVSQDAVIWAQSITQCVRNLAHALTLDTGRMPITRAVTLPALRIKMSDLVQEIAKQYGRKRELIHYTPNAALEAAFGAHPLLATPAAEQAGFAHDGNLAMLVTNALAMMARNEESNNALS